MVQDNRRKDHKFDRCLRAFRNLANFHPMPRHFRIQVDKDYFNFASAHFLIFSNGQREPLHGHNYQVSVTVEGELDRAGVVLDFITFKPIVKQVCDELDHRTLIQSKSALLQIETAGREVRMTYRNQRMILPRKDVLLVPIENTSTELLAEYAANLIRRRTQRQYPGARLRFIEVGVEESRGQRGFYRGEF
jgi:6-pyruvoyltetrahydropterin/6-carboxytetrahydropterin synthase